MFLDEWKKSLVYENEKEKKCSDILKQYYPCYICLTFLANAFSAIIYLAFSVDILTKYDKWEFPPKPLSAIVPDLSFRIQLMN